MGMFSNASDVAVDLGTVNTCIYARGAVVLNEPSVVAFNAVRGGIEAIGADAREMLGRTPANITPIWPMRNGVIADFDAVEKMLAHFVRKATGRTYWRQRLVIGVPAASTPVVLAAPPLGVRNAMVRGPSKSRWIARRACTCASSAEPIRGSTRPPDHRRTRPRQPHIAGPTST